jgi:hypothetical protein
MPANLSIPYYEPSQRVTGRAFGAAVVGKTFVTVAANKDPGSRELDPAATGGNVRIKTAVAADATAGKVIGVAEHDAAQDKATPILRQGFVCPVTAGAAIAAGDLVTAGANGKAVPAAANRPAGISLSVAALDQDAIIMLF